MRLEIISAEKVLFKGNVQRVTLPGSLGTFTILEILDNRIVVCIN